ncbi:MAG: hypothetical protein JSW11_11465 [Candidatus Heimdallarchaeota archaeon]|nr:MAG: hypothetical protein JSW11_11465 [Candidatus Heimdallarchaeota archaeon]
MYTNLFTGLIKGENTENVATLIECEIIPLFQEQQGWEGWRLVINQDNNKLSFLTYWQSKEDAIKVSKSGVFKEQLSKMSPLMVKQSNWNSFELN